MFGNYDWIGGGVTVTGNIQRYLSEIGLKGFFTESISAVTAVFAGRIMFGISQMFVDLRLQKRLNALFVESLDKLFKLFLRFDLL